MIGWEMALTVPLWRVVCCPPWYAGRPLCEMQVFPNVYVHVLSEVRALRVVQNTPHELRRRFMEFVGLS
ncbi:hypothetical protein GGX14DRAFT_330813, partial [Mycena pura]